MTAATRPRYSIEEYARMEDYANLKHEYLDGQIWAMAGGTPEHARTASNVIGALLSGLRGGPCAVYSSDARVRVVATGLDTYPDISVVCDREQRDTGDPLALTNPVLLVEVTSDSSEAYDRGEKFEHYKQIPSLREYVIVSHRDACLDVFRRQEDGAWARVQQARPGERAILASLACGLDVDEVYRDPFKQGPGG